MPRTTRAFLDFLHDHAAHARSAYLLGDLFEAWAGDDDIEDLYHRQIVDAIRSVADQGVALFWIPGNRDFLIGAEFARATGMSILSEPAIVDIAGRHLVLVHGDAQCTDDHDYMQFRTQVRNPAWQAQFLAHPLPVRKSIIEGLRSGSKEAQRSKDYGIMDVSSAAIDELFESSGAQVMIHGHTHRPACHQHGTAARARVRYVLPDWDCDHGVFRGGWLELNEDGTFKQVSLANGSNRSETTA